MFEVQERYQYNGRDGLKWTKWFTIKKTETEEDAKNYVAKYKSMMVKDKLKHELQIINS